jgi:hypothetical protein
MVPSETSPSEKFVRFAAECERMAKFTHTPENKAIWFRMAERWLRCAELHDRQTLAAHRDNSTKRHRTSTHSWSQ